MLKVDGRVFQKKGNKLQYYVHKPPYLFLICMYTWKPQRKVPMYVLKSTQWGRKLPKAGWASSKVGVHFAPFGWDRINWSAETEWAIPTHLLHSWYALRMAGSFLKYESYFAIVRPTTLVCEQWHIVSWHINNIDSNYC